jgi:hypothetical protein
VPRKKKSKRSTAVSAKTRAEDERLRQELAHADPEKFKRFMKPLFGGESLKKKSG